MFTQAQLNGLMKPWVFSYSTDSATLQTQKLVSNADLNKLILFGGPDRFKKLRPVNDLGIKAKKTVYIDDNLRKRITNNARPSTTNLQIAATLFLEKFLSRVTPSYKRSWRKYNSHSAGAVALLYALLSHRNMSDKFYVIGIGAKDGTSHFYDSAFKFGSHGEADRILFSQLAKKFPNVTFTDPDLARFLKSERKTQYASRRS